MVMGSKTQDAFTEPVALERFLDGNSCGQTSRKKSSKVKEKLA